MSDAVELTRALVSLDMVLALVADEEHGSVGSAAVLEHLRASGRLPDACIVGEPTWLDAIVAHRGCSVVEVTLRGRAAHSSRPEGRLLELLPFEVRAGAPY